MPKSDSARKPKLKLPKVWVSFDEDGVEWCTVRRPSDEDMAFSMIGSVHQYAPVQPLRCVWTKNTITGYFDSACCGGSWHPTNTKKFCADCGGRIVRRVK